MYPNQVYPYNRPGRPNMPGRPNFPNNPGDDRIGLLGPFVLGGITGGLLAPAFYPRPYPPYPPYPPYRPYPPYYYGPYYR